MLNKLSDLPREAYLTLLGVLIINFSNYMVIPFFTVYFLYQIHLKFTSISIALTLQILTQRTLSIISGILTDRFSPVIKILTDAKISISMDGRGRYLDNIFVERLWRTVKQECIYLQDFQSVTQVKAVLNNYFIYYNNQRLHQALNYRTPAQVYYH